MGKLQLLLNSLSLRTWLGIVGIIIIGIAILWFFTRPPSPTIIAGQNQEVGKQTQIIKEKDAVIATVKGQVQGLQTAYGVLAKQKTQIVQEIGNVKPPESSDELIARYLAFGYHARRLGE